MRRLTGGLVSGLFVIAGLLFAFATPAAAVDFGQPSGSPFTMAGSDPSDIASGDLNGDGRDDIVTSDWDGPGFSVMLAGPNGQMAPTAQGEVPSDAYPNGIALADFNGDGDLDVITVAPIDQTTLSGVEIQFGSGDGTFDVSEVQTLGFTGHAAAVVADDLNGDDDMDFAVTSDTTDEVTVFLAGTTPGSYDTVGPLPVGDEPLAIVAGDLNGDGMGDLATANRSSFFDDAISVLLNNGTSFNPAYDVSGDYQPYDIVTGNFDAGNSLDLAEVNSPNQSLTVKLNDGLAQFTNAPNLPAIPSHWGNALASADFNDDGRDDLAATWTTSVSGEEDDRIGVFLSGADGTMTADPDGPFATDPGTLPWDIVTGDFNGDDKPDFATTAFDEKLSVFINGLVPAPVITIDPASHDFGNHPAGSGPSTAQDFTVTNAGTAPAALASISVTGADSSDFTGTTTCGANLAPEQECTVSVTFDPDTVGSKSASLAVESNAPATSAALSGTGTANAGISVSPSPHDFGDVEVGEESAEQTFTVTNSGTTPLTIDSFQIADDTGEFVVPVSGITCSESLPPEGTCTFKVKFVPGSVGEKSNVLEIFSNASSSPSELPLSGTGIANPDFTLDPLTHDFGTREVGDGPGAPVEFTLTSTGGTALEVGQVTLAGANSGDYKITTDACSGAEVPSGSACIVSVAFEPESLGDRSAQLTFDLGQSTGPAVASLNGMAIHSDPPPPPTPCEPVTVESIRSYRPRVDAKPNALGVRARFTTDRDASVKVAATVKFKYKGKRRSFNIPERKIQVKDGQAKYKAALPKPWNKRLKPLKKVTMVVRYSSKAEMPQCTSFGPKRTQNVPAKVVWIIRG